MRKLLTAAVAVVSIGLVAAPAASAKERLLTLYSPKIDSLPYVHDTHQVTLEADGIGAPAQPGYILGFKEMALVDSKDPKAKPLPIAKMMVHHFLYFAPGPRGPGLRQLLARRRLHRRPRRGAPARPSADDAPEEPRQTYGINNRKADGTAPDWSLTAMVMNHYKRPKSFYVRTRVWYTTEPRKSIIPIVIGNCAQLANGMSYDVAGGGRKGSNYVNSSDWVAPFSGRMLVASSHQHGGGKYQTLDSRTCKRRLFKAPVYHGLPNHPYNAIRPILHEPGPIGTGAYATAKGIPISEGEVLRRTAVHDNHNLHVAAMGFWATWFVEDDSVKRCGQAARRHRRDQQAAALRPHARLRPGRAAAGQAEGRVRRVRRQRAGGRRRVLPARQDHREGRRDRDLELQRVTAAQRDRGQRPARVLVRSTGARRAAAYSVTPKVKGTYRLVCLVHPTTMAETLVVK